jgi:hypothetical protein
MNEPHILDYPALRAKFNESEFECPNPEEELSLPIRDSSRISGFEMMEKVEKDALKALNSQVKQIDQAKQNHDALIVKIDHIRKLASRLPHRQGVSGVSRDKDKGEEVN